MARKILVANWKNHPSSIDEAKSLLSKLARKSKLYKELSFFIAPPTPLFELVRTHSKNFAKLASQDVFSPPTSGSYTSQITIDILKSFGVRLSIIGHSERRALGETSEDVSRKVRLALAKGITPLVCVGELSRDNDGLYYESLRKEIKISLNGLPKKTDILKVIIAYEPIWAIGKTAEDSIDPRELSQSVIFVRKVLAEMFGPDLAKKTKILYGGSVESNNAESLARERGISGFLVGHASLKASEFEIIASSLISS
jgi:triosephosphate isomerase